MEQLLTFDKDNIDPKTLATLKKYTDNPQFVPEIVGKVSKAALGLCLWCRAIDVYARVFKEIEPKRERLRQADEELKGAQGQLAEKQAELQAVVDKVKILEDQLAKAQADQKELQDQADLCEARVDRAAKLTSALGEEQIAWTQHVKDLDLQLDQIIGDVILSSACVTYIGPFNSHYRRRFVDKAFSSVVKYDLNVSESFSLRSTLATDVAVRDWTICGLPSDTQSIDSGVIVMNARNWPLLVDPQQQANKWVRGMLDQNGLRILRPNDFNFMRQVEISVRNGSALLLEDVAEELDSSLTPILAKQLSRQDGRLLIRIGDAEVDYDTNFRLFMTTKLRNPHFLPDVCIQTTVIDFTVTVQGLEDQLLGNLVRKERPALETQKDKLVVSMAADKKQLQDLQDKVLHKLRQSEGLILDNEPLITALQQSKQTSSMISHRFKEALQTDSDISAVREEYRSVAKRASILYFVMDDLAGVNPMYQYSLSFFKAIYNHCIESSSKPSLQATSEEVATEAQSRTAEILTERLASLMKVVTEHTFHTVCRGLFEEHKTLFSILVCFAIERAAGDVEESEWNFFLRGGRVQSPNIREPPPIPGLGAKQWAQCMALEQLFPDYFRGLQESLGSDAATWTKWVAAPAPHALSPPEEFAKLEGSFPALMLLKVMRDEKAAVALSAYVAGRMGRAFAEFPVVQLKHVFPDTNNVTPIVFLLSSGSDPTAMLFKFAHDIKCADSLASISLGQGQGPIAQRLIEKATRKGEWVCLMNCHLAASWMGALEAIVNGFASAPPEKLHANFRLWLTSKPFKSFPVAVLQVSVLVFAYAYVPASAWRVCVCVWREYASFRNVEYAWWWVGLSDAVEHFRQVKKSPTSRQRAFARTCWVACIKSSVKTAGRAARGLKYGRRSSQHLCSSTPLCRSAESSGRSVGMSHTSLTTVT